MEAQLSHREAKGLFLAALDDDLAEREQNKLRAHLDECQDCRSGLDRYAKVVKRVQKVERLKAPKTLASVIMRRVRRRRIFGHRGMQAAYAAYRVPVEAIIPVLIGVLVAAFLVMMAP
ncbi:MAG: zf-HC2 domain-containing protein [Myxococcaceae bacterium]